ELETERIELDSNNDDIFRKLVVQDQSLDDIPAETVSQRRLVNAKRVIRNWLEGKREVYITEDSHDEYYAFLREVQKIVRTGLEVTQYVVEDETESGRLFEVINDRGKDLTNLDRIKSYLVYCSARFNDNDMSREVYTQIGEVLENITKYGGTDSDIETFVRYHWRLFSGELVLARQTNSEYTTVHRRIKHLEKHASLNQEERSVRDWIDDYLESILACSKAYLVIKNPKEIESDYERVNEIVRDLQGLNRLPVSNNFLPLMMATHNRFGIGDEFRRVVSLCEKLSFRVYNVAGRRTDAGRAALQRHGYWIEWAGRQNRANRIFDGGQAALKFDVLSEAIPATCRRIESEIGSNCPDTYFMDCLLRDDLFNGTDRNDGWTGVRDKTVVQYLLYKYEHHLRTKPGRDTMTQMPSFETWKSEGISIEHIHPQNAEGNSELDEITDTLGNLLIIGQKDNSGLSNLDYAQKYEDTYSDSSMKMCEELPSPEEGWSKETANNRAWRIVRFALEEWGNLSKAHIRFDKQPSDTEVSPLEIRNIAHSVRKYHKKNSDDSFVIPSIRFKRENVTGEEWKTMNHCDSCEGIIVDLNSLQDWDATCSGCSSDLPEPVYKFRESDYIKAT
ncbi:HNH endonuclease family protein, partial [Natronococcus sp. A-GB1]|uniref:HNH endonuclease family protein n=1 Tax=Natronococcus sp. A-GB1 TaxID=3037648 RepID=UPI00241DA1B8